MKKTLTRVIIYALEFFVRCILEKNIVNIDSAGKRVDIYVSENFENITRSQAQMLIEAGNVLINGSKVKVSYKLKLEDEIDISMPGPKKSHIIAQEIPLEIIYEDKDIIIVNKPKGMVVHPGNGNFDGTMVNSLMYSHAGDLSGINGVLRPGIVHRIDKDTSGLLVVAKNDIAHKTLTDKFKVHDITREYIALVDGIIEKDKLKINLPIGRDPNDRIKMAVTTKNSKNAITNIEVIKRYYKSNYTLVMAILVTGRTHQIRVHMSYIKHPLVGDEMYGKAHNKLNVKGHLLHATTLGFVHPVTNKYVEFNEKLPEEFNQVLENLDNLENN